MENKKKKVTKTTKKVTKEKPTRKVTRKKGKKKKSAFTLIELLAVIIILGVIMVIAIPSVTKVISSSRDKTYVATVKEAIGSAKTMVNSGEFDFYDSATVDEHGVRPVIEINTSDIPLLDHEYFANKPIIYR